MNDLGSFSPSKFNCFGDCPYSFYLKYVKKVKVFWEEKPWFEKGKYIHYGLEHFPNKPPNKFKFKLSAPDKQKEYQKQLLKILKDPNISQYLLREHNTEERLKVSKEWNTDKKSLLNGIVDYFCFENDTCIIIDWKTGKIYKDKGELQLKLYALWIFLKYPNINTVKSCYYYVEHGEQTEYVYKRKNLQQIKDYFVNKIKEISEIETFDKNPNVNCKYCDFYGRNCSPVFKKEKL